MVAEFLTEFPWASFVAVGIQAASALVKQASSSHSSPVVQSRVVLQIALPIQAIPNKWMNDALLSSLPHQATKSWFLHGDAMDWYGFSYACTASGCLGRGDWMARWGLTLVMWPQSALRPPSSWCVETKLWFLCIFCCLLFFDNSFLPKLWYLHEVSVFLCVCV